MFRPTRIIPLAALIAALVLQTPAGVLGQERGAGEVVFRSDSLMIAGWAQARSVSPDGKWIAFRASLDWERHNLFVMPAAGGDVIQLTRGPFDDRQPVWAPNGRSIFFRSNRVDNTGYVMKIPVDPKSARAAGIPRPVSMVRARGPSALAVSPDGAHVAFVGVDESGESTRLVVVPSGGGASRILVERVPGSVTLGWDAASEHVYFPGPGSNGSGHLLYRVGLDGGDPVALPELSQPGRALLSISGDGTRFLWGAGGEPGNLRGCFPNGRCSSWVVTDERGHEVGSILGGNWPALSPVNGSFFRAEGQEVMDVVVAPIVGGEPTELTGLPKGGVLGWTRAGELFFATEQEGDEALFLLSPVTGQRRRVRMPDASGDIQPIIHPDGRHVLHATAQAGGKFASLVIHDLETGEDRVVSTRLPSGGTPWSNTRLVVGRGGHPMIDDGRFLFVEIAPDNLTRIVRAVTPDGPVETLAELNEVGLGPRGQVGVHGNSVAWIDREHHELTLFDGAGGQTRTLIRSERELWAPRWSNDGRTIALAYGTWRESGQDLAFLRIDDPDGELVVKEVDPTLFYDIQWTADDALLVAGAEGANASVDTDVWVVDPWSDAPAVPVVSNPDVYPFGSEVSPDGRWVAYAVIRSAGSALVRYHMDPPGTRPGGGSGRR